MHFLSRSPGQTRNIGMCLGRVLLPGDVICLQGDLGAGKTTFVQGLPRDGTHRMRSPARPLSLSMSIGMRARDSFSTWMPTGSTPCWRQRSWI